MTLKCLLRYRFSVRQEPPSFPYLMRLTVNPPVAPMLAKPVDAIPSGDYIFEPKWDGFRSIVFRDGDEVEIGSRNERPMTRYFPELVAAIKTEMPERCVI